MFMEKQQQHYRKLGWPSTDTGKLGITDGVTSKYWYSAESELLGAGSYSVAQEAVILLVEEAQGPPTSNP